MLKDDYMYILNNDKTVEKVDFLKYIEWKQSNVNKNKIKREWVGKLDVSTVFLNTMHCGDTLFETMVFDDDMNEKECHRYKNYEEAVKGHNKIVERLKNVLHI